METTMEKGGAQEFIYISLLTAATRAPLKSLTSFTNLLVHGAANDKQCLYEIERSGKRLAFLMDELHGAGTMEHKATIYSLPQLIDDVLACIEPIAISYNRNIFPFPGPDCPDRVYGIEPNLRALLFNYLLQQVVEADLVSSSLRLEFDYIDEGIVCFALQPSGHNPPAPSARLQQLLEESQTRLERGSLVLPLKPVDDQPVFSGLDLKASVIDDNETRRQSLESRLKHLGIFLIEPVGNAGPDFYIVGQRDESAYQEDASVPTFHVDGTILSGGNHSARLRKPIDHGELIGSIQSSVLAHRPAANTHVLVVDDHVANLRLSALILEELGLQVHTATNGPDAVKIAEQENLQLIIMDVNMPLLDGFQATLLIRESQGENLPIIGLSANITSEDRTRLQLAGMNDVLVKPLDRSQLEGIIDTWVPTPHRPDQNNAVAETHADYIEIYSPEIALKLANNNAQLADELLQLMIASLPEDQLKINEAWHRKNNDLFLESIHRINGAARYCGIPRLARSIDQLESAVKLGTNEDVDTALGIFNEEAHCLLAWYLDNPDPLDTGTNAARQV